MKHTAIWLLALLGAVSGWAQTGENCSLLARIEGAPGSSTVVLEGNTAWAAFGAEGVRVFDLASAEAPAQLGQWNPNGYGSASLLARHGDLLWVANSDQVRCLSGTDPANLELLSLYTAPSSVQALETDGQRLFVLTRGSGLRVVDVSAPESPVELAAIPARGEWLLDLVIRGPLLFLAEGTDGVRILDATDVQQPLELGVFPTWFAQGLALSEDGTRLFVADDMAGLRILDVSDPAQPQQLGLLDTPGFAEAVCVHGDHAYLADHFHGLRIVSVEDPGAPVEVGYLETAGNAHDLAVQDGLVLLCDLAQGLLVVRHDGLTDMDPGLTPGRNARPASLELRPAVPNPFNPGTRLAFRLDQPQRISVRVYSLDGRCVSTLARGLWPAGEHSLVFEAGHLPSGTYFCLLEGDSGQQARQLVLLR